MRQIDGGEPGTPEVKLGAYRAPSEKLVSIYRVFLGEGDIHESWIFERQKKLESHIFR